MTGGKISVHAWKIYIMRNSLYFICILIDFSETFRHREPGFPVMKISFLNSFP